MQVGEQLVIVEARLKTLVKEAQAIFLNGPTPFETAQEIIEKVEDTRKVVKDFRKNFEVFYD